MFSEPQIYNPVDMDKRGFVSIYLDGKRNRFYNGALLDLTCNPNYAKTHTDRERELRRLSRALMAAVQRGWRPEDKKTIVAKVVEPAICDFLGSLPQSLPESYSGTYRRDLKRVCEEFGAFLKKHGWGTFTARQIEPKHVEGFLQTFTGSGTYYMNKRRTLSAVFLRLQQLGHLEVNPVGKTSKRKSKAVLHQAYTEEQMGKVLPFLQEHYSNLYLCALLMYGTLLRPHREIRLLKRRHFNEDLTRYTLDGYENKGGRIRSLPVPEYVRVELLRRQTEQLEPERFVFTGYHEPFNESYFNTMWSRAKTRMLELRLIQPKQTLYSFRHAASLNVFERTQNLKLLQQLLGHSNLNTSMIYLRSIGAVQVEATMMPEL